MTTATANPVDDADAGRASGAPRPPGSERLRLARASQNAALAIPGVEDLDGGPGGRFMTAGGTERILGVRCVAGPDGGYDVTLRLRCALVCLPEVGEQVSRAVHVVAAELGLPIASLQVEIVDVVAPEPAR